MKLTRREFLRVSVFAGATFLAACAPTTSSPVERRAPTLSPSPAPPTPTATPLPTPTPPPTRLGALKILNADYPRAYFFRIAESFAANERVDYVQWERAFNRLFGIEGKALDEEVPGRSKRNIEFFTRFKQQQPDQLVLLHYNGNARDPNQPGEKFFDGHWLYFNGAKILADVPAETGETEIRVANAALFRVNIGRYQNANEDIGLCELDAQGKPNWRASEQVELIAVDARRNTIRVRRGAYGTTPRAFSANRAYAAAHCAEGPWGEKSHLLWLYNYAPTCPRDANGKTCTDILVGDLAEKFLPGGALEKFDGVQFDVLWNALTGNIRSRAPDVDADGNADVGVLDGVNVYGNGVVEFCRKLRERLGEDRLILADGWNARNQRAFGILNGIEAEGWPSLSDARVDDWSGGINRQTFWVAHARAPRFSYINHKFNIGEGDFNNKTEFPYATHRLVFAGAVFTDSAICYSLLPPAEKNDLVGIWDELWMGQAQRIGWLGKPLAPAVHLAERQTDLLAKLSPPELRARFQGAGMSITLEGDALKIAANDPNATVLRFALTLPTNGADLVVVFAARAASDIARLAQINFNRDEASPFWINPNAFKFYHYRGDVRGDAVELHFEIEGGAPVWLSRIAAYAYPDAMYREFENGLVIANPSLRAFTFDLPALFPNKNFRRLRGSALQDPKTNDGSVVSGAVALGARDALFLTHG